MPTSMSTVMILTIWDFASSRELLPALNVEFEPNLIKVPTSFRLSGMRKSPVLQIHYGNLSTIGRRSTPDQVKKMAERNKLPGRRIGGQWRFSQPEIHQWFEERIGASDVLKSNLKNDPSTSFTFQIC